VALQKAVNSEDADLIYLTLIHIERSSTDLDTFHRLVYSHTAAVNLLKVFYRSKTTPTDRQVVRRFLIFNKNYLEAGTLAVRQAYADPATDIRDTDKVKMLKESAQIFSSNRDLGVYKSATEEQIELIDIQRILGVRCQRSFHGMTVVETIHQLLILSIETPIETPQWEAEISKIIKKFKISEKHIWHIRIQTYCKMGSYLLLNKLAGEKKSPVGYKIFALTCMNYKVGFIYQHANCF
jgi:hypothetical protein